MVFRGDRDDYWYPNNFILKIIKYWTFWRFLYPPFLDNYFDIIMGLFRELFRNIRDFLKNSSEFNWGGENEKHSAWGRYVLFWRGTPPLPPLRKFVFCGKFVFFVRKNIWEGGRGGPYLLFFLIFHWRQIADSNLKYFKKVPWENKKNIHEGGGGGTSFF